MLTGYTWVQQSYGEFTIADTIMTCSFAAGNELGLDRHQRARLFYESDWPESFHERYAATDYDDYAERARIAAEPVLSACVCETEEEPDLYRVYHWQDQHAVECECGRNVGGPTRDIAIRMWNRCMEPK